VAVRFIAKGKEKKGSSSMALLVGQPPSTTFNNCWTRLLAVVLLVLPATSTLVSWQANTEPLQASTSTVVSAVAGSPESDFSSVISTADASEEQVDIDPNDLGSTFGVGCISVVMLGSAGLLSAFYEEPAKVSSDCCSALERPG
jgi:hypothetical protein